MSRGLPALVKNHVDKAHSSALQAVAAYNNPLSPFRSGAFIVLMVIAWTSLLLAVFIRKGAKPYYRQRKKHSGEPSIRYVRVDGEPKPWELHRCAKEYWNHGTNPVGLPLVSVPTIARALRLSVRARLL